VTAAEYHRARLRRAAEVRFMIGAERRDARRKRWAEQALAKEICAAFVSGALVPDLVAKYKITRERIGEFVKSNATPEQLLNRRRMLNNGRMRKLARWRNPNMVAREHKKPIGPFASIYECARANGVKPRTMWMRIYRGRPGVDLSAMAS
jgi:hypothetical protein